MSSLLTSDLHIEVDINEPHRERFLAWVAQMAIKYELDQVIILGDLTVKKDRHDAQLLNLMAGLIARIAKRCPVYIVKGNHDYLDPLTPFFLFLQNIPNVYFIVRPQQAVLRINAKKVKVLFLPHTRDYENEWKDWDFSRYQYIFTHATFQGALVENGSKMDGIPLSVFRGTKAKVWSGDIHVPQRLGKVNYVGAPYRIRYGDNFLPRLVLLRNGKAEDITYSCPLKHLLEVDSVDQLSRMANKVSPGDYVKVRYRLQREDFSKWDEIRNDIYEVVLKRGWLVQGGVEPVPVQYDKDTPPWEERSELVRKGPKEIVKDFAKGNKIDKSTLSVGLKLLEKL